MDTKRIEFARSKAAGIIALACLLTVVVLLYEPFNLLGITLLTIFFVAIASGNTLFGLLKMRAALWLGEISYSIYLCHGLILWIIMQNILPRFSAFNPTAKLFVISAVVITPVVILFSSASYLLLERPLIAIGHTIARPTATAIAVPTP
jgi:peptidoglycan/LPS O-acetylase OafA/YrhL